MALLERLLPRQMQIIYAINAEVLTEARTRAGFTDQQIANVSLIDEHGARRVRIGQLAFVGSHSINGVSALHTELMKKTVFADLHRLYPERINNKTNGVTPRRWLLRVQSGPHQADHRPDRSRVPRRYRSARTVSTRHADDPDFQEQFAAVKQRQQGSALPR